MRTVEINTYSDKIGASENVLADDEDVDFKDPKTYVNQRVNVGSLGLEIKRSDGRAVDV